MEKIVIITLACISLIVVVCILIDIPSIIRYNKLKKSNINSYINEYRNKEKCTKEKVVVSLTSTSQRIDKIIPMLNSLLNQTTKVDQIALNIPSEYHNLPKEYKNICNVFEVGRDYGKGTKFSPTLLREKNCGTKIILVDDDYIYGEDLIENLIKQSEKYPDKCVYVGDDFQNSPGILIKPEFVDKISREKCDNNWLEHNLKVDKIKIPYKKNMKYI